MKAPRLRSISLEALGEIPAEMKPVMDRLLGLLNPHLTEVGNGLAGGLSRSENMLERSKEITVRVPEYPWTNLDLSGGDWTAIPDTYATPSYMVEPGGKIRLRGGITGGTLNTVAFTLPITTSSVQQLPTFSWAGVDGVAVASSIWIDPNGDVYPLNGATLEFALDGAVILTEKGPPTLPFTAGQGWPIEFDSGLPVVVRDVQITQIVDLDAKDGSGQGGVVATPYWDLGTRGQIRVHSIYGLVPGRNYRLRFRVSGE